MIRQFWSSTKRKQVQLDDATQILRFLFRIYHNEKRSHGFTNVHPAMTRCAIVIGIIAAVACSHPRSFGNRQRQSPVAVDSDFVSSDELWEDVRQGHTNVYDALKSTRPEILHSGRDGLQVYVDYPLGFGGCCNRIMDLRQISTAQVKWIRRYSPGIAPGQAGYYSSSSVLLVVLR